jgi:hypothetical protein
MFKRTTYAKKRKTFRLEVIQLEDRIVPVMLTTNYGGAGTNYNMQSVYQSGSRSRALRLHLVPFPVSDYPIAL